MEYIIIDNQNYLSKTQKSKIRSMLRDGLNKKEILEKIHYEDSTKRYKDYILEKINERQMKVVFHTKDHHDELKERLKHKIQNKEILRNNNYKDDSWKMYYQLIQHPTIQALPNESIKNAIPTPDQIKQQKDVYKMINKMNPNPMIKKYIDLCLENC